MTTSTDAKQAPFAQIPLPPGASTNQYWSPIGDEADGLHWRDLEWWNCHGSEASEASVTVCGDQFSDGRFGCKITISFDDDSERGTITTSAGARELAAALLEAADKFDGVQR
jgi:hypothetical protein